MPRFSISSNSKLATSERDLQNIMKAAIKIVDFTIVYGHRTVSEQQELYAQGRTTKGNIITYCDGVETKSRHNYYPSKAIDIVPYPEGWKDENRFHYVAGVIMTIADQLWKEGAIEKRLEWGGNWTKLKDLPHFQIK